ncbi:hypothetical protein ACFVH6_23060 [Spirillospora sp. NPDC127200]
MTTDGSQAGGSTTGSGGTTAPTTPPRDQRVTDARNKGLKGGAGAAGGGVVAGLTGGSVVGTADGLMAMATGMVSAALVLPPALMISFMYRLSTGKAGNLEKAAAEWGKAADELQTASRTLRRLVDEIPEYAWSMDDRDTYENKAHEFSLQVDALHNYLMAVSIALTVLAWALFTYAVFAMGMAVYIDALAVLAVAALASVVGSVAYPELLALAATGATITNVATGILAAAGGIAGLAMFAGGSFVADYQQDHGNAGADGLFGKAVATGSAGAAANLLQNAGNAGLSWLNRSDMSTMNVNGRRVGGRGSLLTEIDLDADRDIERTWTIGGGAKARTPLNTEHELGGNFKYGDDGFAGGELSNNNKWSSPGGAVSGEAGGKVEWDDKGDVGGGFKVGGGSDAAGSTGGYEGNWDQQGAYTDKYEVSTPAYNTEGSIAGEKANETPPWDK